MKKYEVDSITKPDRSNQHERITHIGNNVVPWRMTVSCAIRRIDGGEESFYVKDPSTGKIAYIGVMREDGKAPYLKTYADGVWNNNLLSLPECDHRSKLIC